MFSAVLSGTVKVFCRSLFIFQVCEVLRRFSCYTLVFSFLKIFIHYLFRDGFRNSFIFFFFFFFFFGVCVCVFWFSPDRVSLCSPGCPGTHAVDQ
jgi:hypothetical protein